MNNDEIEVPRQGHWYVLDITDKSAISENLVYVVINKATKVIEAESKMLPQACQFMRDLERAYAAELAYKEAESIEQQVQQGVVSSYKRNQRKVN